MSQLAPDISLAICCNERATIFQHHRSYTQAHGLLMCKQNILNGQRCDSIYQTLSTPGLSR
jgi:hypothetical protein